MPSQEPKFYSSEVPSSSTCFISRLLYPRVGHRHSDTSDNTDTFFSRTLLGAMPSHSFHNFGSKSAREVSTYKYKPWNMSTKRLNIYGRVFIFSTKIRSEKVKNIDTYKLLSYKLSDGQRFHTAPHTKRDMLHTSSSL